ncbi:ATP-binding protein [Thermodesulfobacteriota bacterium]
METFYNGNFLSLLEDLDPEINALEEPEIYLKDPNNWISCSVVSRMYERARLMLNDDMAAYKMAKKAAENFKLGYAQKIIIKAFWSGKQVLKNLQKVNDKWNRNKKVELVETKGNEAVIRLHWDKQMDVSKDICLYNQGAYTFMPLIWKGKAIKLDEKCCYFEGAPYCEYHLRMPFRNRFNSFYSRIFTSKSVLRATIGEMEKDKEVIEKKYEEVNHLNVELNQKIKQIMAIQETGKAILSVLNLEELLQVIMSILSNVCQINRAIIMLVNEEKKCLEYLYGEGYGGEIPEEIKSYNVPLNRVSNILVRVTNTGQPEYIPEVRNSSLRKENIMLAHGNPSSVYVVPLITQSKVIGVLATDGVNVQGVPQETRDTLEIFTPQIAIAIENAKLYNRLQKQMMEIKQSQALLSRAEKFSFLGNLAARLAHEIKNPMTAIGTFIQMLPRKFGDEEFRRDFYQVAMEETDRVNNLTTELLDLVKTRESHFEFSDLHNLIEKMILLISPQSNEKQIKVVKKFDSKVEMVWLDSEKMKQIMLNILSNAVEFTSQRGRIEILTKYLHVNEGSDSVRIQIKDNGAGIPQPMHNRIFDPYFTTKHRNSIRNGTGLGLFIAHQNMQDHKGTIEVRSQVKKGTTFILKIPAEQPSQAIGQGSSGLH